MKGIKGFMKYKVKKRDGSFVDFQIEKISQAIIKAFESLKLVYDESIIELLSLRVIADFKNKMKEDTIDVEEIQDSVESVLALAGYNQVAKAYILYRKQRANVRQIARFNFMKTKESSTIEQMRANIIHTTIQNLWENELYDEKIRHDIKQGVFSIAGMDDFRLYITTIDRQSHLEMDALEFAKMVIELSQEFQNLMLLHMKDLLLDRSLFVQILKLADSNCKILVDYPIDDERFYPVLADLLYPEMSFHEPIFARKEPKFYFKSSAVFCGEDEKEKERVLQAVQVRNEVIDQLLRMGFYPNISKYHFNCLLYPSHIEWNSLLKPKEMPKIHYSIHLKNEGDGFETLSRLENMRDFDTKLIELNVKESNRDRDANNQLIQKIKQLFPSIDFFKLF